MIEFASGSKENELELIVATNEMEATSFRDFEEFKLNSKTIGYKSNNSMYEPEIAVAADEGDNSYGKDN